MILGVDPGGLTGIAVLNYDGLLVHYGNYGEQELQDFLQEDSPLLQKVDQIVMEQFVLYRGKAQKQTGSKMPASRVIGIITFWAKLKKIPIEYQMAGILPIAVKWSKRKPVGKHSDNHWVDAYNHVFYWLVKNRRIKPHANGGTKP